MSDKCAKCEIPFSIHEPKVTVDGVDYCSKCAEEVKSEPAKEVTPPTYEEQMLNLNKQIYAQAVRHTDNLNSIRSTMTILLVLLIIGIVVQGCAGVLGL